MRMALGALAILALLLGCSREGWYGNKGYEWGKTNGLPGAFPEKEDKDECSFYSNCKEPE